MIQPVRATCGATLRDDRGSVFDGLGRLRILVWRERVVALDSDRRHATMIGVFGPALETVELMAISVVPGTGPSGDSSVNEVTYSVFVGVVRKFSTLARLVLGAVQVIEAAGGSLKRGACRTSRASRCHWVRWVT